MINLIVNDNGEAGFVVEGATVSPEIEEVGHGRQGAGSDTDAVWDEFLGVRGFIAVSLGLGDLRRCGRTSSLRCDDLVCRWTISLFFCCVLLRLLLLSGQRS